MALLMSASKRLCFSAGPAAGIVMAGTRQSSPPKLYVSHGRPCISSSVVALSLSLIPSSSMHASIQHVESAVLSAVRSGNEIAPDS